MSTVAITTVIEARVIANAWVISNLPDRFAAGIPERDQSLVGWRIPVWLSYPQLVPLGPVGDLLIDDTTGRIVEHTPIDQMKDRAIELYEEHREQIEAPLL